MLLFPKFIANNFLFKWSVSPTRDCCLDTRWVLFIYLWFQGDDESLIDSQTIITGQILDNNTQRLTIENILVARAGQAAACWLSDLVARGRLGWALRGENCQSGEGRGEPHVRYEWAMIWGRCQVIIPMGEAEREKNEQKERINSSCWLWCSARSYLFVQECWANIFSKFWSESSHLATRRRITENVRSEPESAV